MDRSCVFTVFREMYRVAAICKYVLVGSSFRMRSSAAVSGSVISRWDRRGPAGRRARRAPR